MPLIKVEITSCKQCKHFFSNNHFSTDNWDMMEDWNCKLLNRKIATAIEWYEEKNVQIPKDCPILINSTNI